MIDVCGGALLRVSSVCRNTKWCQIHTGDAVYLIKAVKAKKTQVEKNFIPLDLRIATVHAKSGKGEENIAELCCDIEVVPSFFMTLESSW